MLAFDDALRIVLGAAHCLGIEQVAIISVMGRILAEDARSDVDMPPFNKSTRDGYACRRMDLANKLTIVETIPAGYTPQKTIGSGQCAKIMTGAMLPEGADCVIMLEFTEKLGENAIRFNGGKTHDNVTKRGEDVRKGQVVLHKGDIIGPQQIAVLASVGCVRPRVALRPRVGIITTGSELIPAGQTPRGSMVRDSNGPQLVAQARQCGASPSDYGAVGDVKERIAEAIDRAAAENDVIVISGGVSVGDFDYVPESLRQNHFDLLFEKIAVKPGKPTVFAVRNGAYCFGLPGNPVSAFVIFEALVKPFLYKMMGHDYRPRYIQARLAESVERKDTDRLEWLPVLTADDGTAKFVEYHGSGHINALSRAGGLVAIDRGKTALEKGAVISVRLFD